MPERVNSLSDIGTAKVSSDSYDVDNIFLTDQGWVYRHWKGYPAVNPDCRYWDEIIVAGEVITPASTTPPIDNEDVELTVYEVEAVDKDGNLITDGLGATIMIPTGNQQYANPLAGGGEFETTSATSDGESDIQYSPDALDGPALPKVGAARYTTYAQYPPIPTDTPDTDVPAPPASAPADVTLEFTGADGTSSYTSAGGANASVTIESGATLTITNNTGGHPVDVRVADGGATVSTGTLTGAPAGPGESLTWDTTGVTAGTYYYQCTAHATMIGQIIVT